MIIDNVVNLSPKRPLSILHLEDTPSDAELVRSKLNSKKIDCDRLRIEHLAGFVAALEKDRFALILADYGSVKPDSRAGQHPPANRRRRWNVENPIRSRMRHGDAHCIAAGETPWLAKYAGVKIIFPFIIRQ